MLVSFQKKTLHLFAKQVTDPVTIIFLKKPPGKKMFFEQKFKCAKLQYNLFLNNNNLTDIEVRYKG